MRQGTSSTKTRSEVRGTTKKAAPQKGRGKARVGNMKAPQFRGGKVYLFIFLKKSSLLLIG